MATLPARKTILNLRKKGFVQKEGDHHFFEFWHKGKLISRTYTSHNDQNLDDYLISAMRKQCNMDKQFFIDFAKCTKSKQDYIDLLFKNGDIDEK